MSILDDPAWLEDGRRFCAKLDRITREMMKPLGPDGWRRYRRAHKVFQMFKETRQEGQIRLLSGLKKPLSSKA